MVTRIQPAIFRVPIKLYITSTDSGPGVLRYWRGKDIMPKSSMHARWIAVSTSDKHFFRKSLDAH